jgi:hypothetical protein
MPPDAGYLVVFALVRPLSPQVSPTATNPC